MISHLQILEKSVKNHEKTPIHKKNQGFLFIAKFNPTTNLKDFHFKP
jgi:hypothetical protein